MPPPASSVPLAELLAEHRRLIDAIDGHERQLLQPRPDTFAALATRRWAFARELMQHCAHEEVTVLRPLAADCRPQVAAEAVRLLDEQGRLVADFKEHVRRWGTFASATEWPDYLRSARGLLHRLRRCIQAEETALYPHLPAQRGTGGVAQRPYADAPSARQLGDLIFRGKPLD